MGIREKGESFMRKGGMTGQLGGKRRKQQGLDEEEDKIGKIMNESTNAEKYNQERAKIKKKQKWKT